ncbi:helicase-related protein [Roseomonas genomospecies 6]|uniref:helicase-related protein n=1 Tax=Roseomonas genomospecies 6 TaxID=214106 RepID=UPI00142F2251|nr:helicase-related protein [Roseomonas genomospecies 6]
MTARGRDWIVLPPDEPDVLRLRSVTAGASEEIGIFLPIEGEGIHVARFPAPGVETIGDAAGALTLFDAARLALRSGAAPFRSLGRISVVPRPYQFVPLIMALRLDPVRLLLADDVGVGKTVEAAMIAREALDRGLAKRLAVLCPAHLCDQWQRELSEKFAIEAELVIHSRLSRLERSLPRQDISLFAHLQHFVASIDLLKSDRHRPAFLSGAPDLIVVDEAHTAARPGHAGDRTQHQRFELLRALMEDSRRHLILVTATPHSGVEESFRSLLGLLKPALEGNPGAPLNHRAVMPHVVQRRRRDVERWLGSETPFPSRDSSEISYDLSRDYRRLFDDVLDYCRETVGDPDEPSTRQRVRHWAAIALLRCVLSSPGAAEAVLANRSRRLEEDTVPPDAVPDERYGGEVLDGMADGAAVDYAPTGPLQDADWTDAEQRRLTDFLRRAKTLRGRAGDHKLARLAEAVKELLNGGCRPIVFCRFIPTARYLGEQLPALLGEARRGLDLRVVTGEMGDEQRRETIAELAGSERRLLIATDCLSEGINLQEHFDAVIHYDLPWNPNRLEQREGRVDRFGQPKDRVRTLLLYGADNQVDLVVLDVLIRKARQIRDTLNVSVPVPADAEKVVQTVVDTVLMHRSRSRGRAATVQLELAFDTGDISRLHRAWDEAAERERRDGAHFAQGGIRPDEVAREIAATDGVLGDSGAVLRFLSEASMRFGGQLRTVAAPHIHELHAGDLRDALRRATGADFPCTITLDRRADPDALYVGRTHPVVAALCEAVLGRTFAPDSDERFPRVGVMRTAEVRRRTVLLLVRLRYLLRERVQEFAEEVVLAATQRDDEGRLVWLDPIESAGRDLAASVRPAGNVAPAEKREQIESVLGDLTAEPGWFAPLVERRRDALAEAHRRLRRMVDRAAPDLAIETYEPDILGCFVLLPGGVR